MTGCRSAPQAQFDQHAIRGRRPPSHRHRWSPAAAATLPWNAASSRARAVLAVLQGLDWVGRLTEQNDLGQARQVLLVDPTLASVAPLADRLLVLRASPTDPVWQHTGLDQIRLAQLLPAVALPA